MRILITGGTGFIGLGLVLEKHGGILTEMALPFKFGLGRIIEHGNQWMSWVHLDDVVDRKDALATIFK